MKKNGKSGKKCLGVYKLYPEILISSYLFLHVLCVWFENGLDGG